MTTTTKTLSAAVQKKAEQLMRYFVQSQENKKRKQAEIAEELKAYDESMKAAEQELLVIGALNLAAFDGDGNLNLGDGYLHLANSAVVVTGRKFDVATFNEAHPELIKIELKKGEIKKAFQDKELRKELKALGVDIDNEQTMQVIANKSKV